jgi:ribonuclease HI
MTSDAPLYAATDGSALGNPGPGGWSWYIHEGRWASGGYPGPVTNNQMELMALLRLLEHAPDDHLAIAIDSQYVINAVTKWAHGWSRNAWRTKTGADVANRDIIEPIMTLMAHRSQRGLVTHINWVRGHNGHPANEAADVLARTAAQTAATTKRSVRHQPGA